MGRIIFQHGHALNHSALLGAHGGIHLNFGPNLVSKYPFGARCHDCTLVRMVESTINVHVRLRVHLCVLHDARTANHLNRWAYFVTYLQ